MPDHLTTLDRELIAEAFAAGRVTICPANTYTWQITGEEVPSKWNSRAVRAKPPAPEPKERGGPRGPYKPRVLPRDTLVWGYIQSGKGPQEIAVLIEMREASVYALLSKMRRRGYEIPNFRERVRYDRSQIDELYLDGMTMPAIAERLGLPVKQVREYVRRQQQKNELPRRNKSKVE